MRGESHRCPTCRARVPHGERCACEETVEVELRGGPLDGAKYPALPDTNVIELEHAGQVHRYRRVPGTAKFAYVYPEPKPRPGREA